MPSFKAAPMYPPRAWFANPHLATPTALTVDDSGRIRGHACTWDAVHTGYPGQDVHPPREPDFRHFTTGQVKTRDGSLVATGRLSLGGGHADLKGSVRAAVDHYEEVATAVADIAVGADKFGVWMAGALRPTATENDVRVLRASSVSADWRAIQGRLRMLAICAVNVAGFATPRSKVALAASGRPLALVAAGPPCRTRGSWAKVRTPEQMVAYAQADALVASIDAEPVTPLEARLRRARALVASIPPETPQEAAERQRRAAERARRAQRQLEFEARMRLFDSAASHRRG